AVPDVFAAHGVDTGEGRAGEFDLGPDRRAYHLRYRLYLAVLPQFLCRRTIGAGEGGTGRRRRPVSHFYAYYSAAVDADSDGIGDLAVHSDLERFSVRRRFYHR